MSFQIISKPLKNRWMIGLIIGATCMTGVIVYYRFSTIGQTPSLTEQTAIPQVQQVTALGKIQPLGEVIKVSVPATLSNDRVAQLMVNRGDKVKAGDVIAVMNARSRLQSILLEAQEQVRVSQSELAKVKAGAKTGEIGAQQATIARLKVENTTLPEAQRATINRLVAEKNTETEAQQATIARLISERETEIAAQKALIESFQAELNNAQTEFTRNQQLFQEGAISASLRDTKRLSLQKAQQQYNEAQANLKRIQGSRQQQIIEARANLSRIQASRQQQIVEAQANLRRIESSGKEQVNEAAATLNKIIEVRPVDVQSAQANVDKANAAVKRAKADLDDSYIRAPSSGRILEIHAKAGEVVDTSGIAELGQTDQMEVVAEVYQTDISKIRPGKQAIITSESFTGEVRGAVNLVGIQVTPQEITSGQPGENLERRVVEVRIRLNPESSKRVANLTNLQVQVAIQI
ncbi:devB secretion protein [Dulcicalothrix desertica PCC 7102]|uniref:DevB secretion protein n=1 Tax=Dulcicalothrix desertica PCC 7102 TaxID=232991 RepID=A0A433US07_9CYAN|nr:HlyD family efflux transporter periplasmic adaptor subunit [Dulcicalothrix desertica]RUS96630.1 devB secretion protein [Dulcicalothrix desertica PCC 7102]TWH54882.1 HlyD family secretion protein [Dulcicalothrix desertica PCC 7102]